MADHLSLQELSKRLAFIDQRDPQPLYQLVRSWHQQGLLVASERVGSGRTSAAVFDIDEQCLARIFLFLRDWGIAGRSLRHVRTFLTAEKIHTTPDGKQVRYSLAAAIEGLPKGEAWIARLYRNTDSDTGEAVMSGRCDRVQNPAWDDVPSLTFPLGPLLLPIITGD